MNPYRTPYRPLQIDEWECKLCHGRLHALSNCRRVLVHDRMEFVCVDCAEKRSREVLNT